MAGERGFSAREIGAFLGFAVVGVLLGLGAYRAGGGLAGAGGAVLSAAPAGAVPDGRALYAGNCAGCHGAQAQGGVGPALTDAAAWNGAEFARAVLSGQTPDKQLGAAMPRFGSVGLDGAPATDAQVDAIHVYLMGLR